MKQETIVDQYFKDWSVARELTGRQRGANDETIVRLEVAVLGMRRFALPTAMDAELAEACIGPKCIFKGKESPVTRFEIIPARSAHK